jgi:hypothetical protein
MSGSALAQQAPSNTNIAGPSASATGNVTNQAVQVLQGPYAVNTYGGGVSCQGATFSISPFVTRNNNNSADPEAFESNSGNWGISAGLNIPLDNSLLNLCRQRVEVEITRQQAEADKARLDFELVRLLKCGEAIKEWNNIPSRLVLMPKSVLMLLLEYPSVKEAAARLP